MRGSLTMALTALAALVLAACNVNVEGAACAVPGSTANCPAGQACGTGLTCSARAAGCGAGGPCVAGATACRSGSADVMECSGATDPVCGTWVLKTACSPGVTQCGTPAAGGSPACRCEQFIVDPAGFGTGQTCRFGSISSAMTAASSWSVGTVLLGGATGQTYGLTAADTAPIVIPAGLTVAGIDTPFVPANRVIEVQGSGGEGIRVEAGGRLAGVTVVRGAAPAPGLAVRVTGGSPAGGNSLEAVNVDGSGPGGAFLTGLRVEGGGNVLINAVTVLDATASGLEIERTDGAQAVTFTDAVADGRALAASGNVMLGVGVSVLKGDVTLIRPVVKRSGGTGLVASAAAANEISLTVQDAAIHDNFGTGIVAQSLARLHLTGSLVCKNKGGAARNISGTSRLVGGMFAAGMVPPGPALLRELVLRQRRRPGRARPGRRDLEPRRAVGQA